MATPNLEKFLSSSSIAQRARVDLRVVLRRFAAPLRDIDSALRLGTLAAEGTAICELVAGDTVLARGEIVAEDGQQSFRVTEVME